MSETSEAVAQSTDTRTADASPRPSFITPEMIEKNPALAAAGMFADSPYFDELVKEIKKERARQQRRDRKEFSK
ncbi:MAG: hypothetical protein H8F28_26525 [Fibrella sp.]|nr:hypothetical protein [Armatimonadota bacterium]